MNAEARLIMEVWELVRDQIPNAKRLDVASGLLYAFEEYGFDARDIQEIVDEDTHLAKAFRDLFDAEEEEPLEED